MFSPHEHANVERLFVWTLAAEIAPISNARMDSINMDVDSPPVECS